MHEDCLIRLEQAESIHPDFRLDAPVSLEIRSGETLAVLGPNGSGKTLLTDLLLGGHPLRKGRRWSFADRTAGRASGTDAESAPEAETDGELSGGIRYMAFQDLCWGAEYHQQRWNQADTEDFPTVDEVLEEDARRYERELAGISVYEDFIVRDEDASAQERRTARTQRRRMLARERIAAMRRTMEGIFPLGELHTRRTILLSSGETRKFQLTRILLACPRVLILDNPLIGLDARARDSLNAFLSHLAASGTCTLVLILSREDEIPPCVTHVVPVRDRKVLPKRTTEDYLAWRRLPLEHPLTEEAREEILNLPDRGLPFPGDEVLSLRDICIRYGSRTILNHLDLTVRRGEHWALSGENGSGKSTLLSLVCADNPQAYANRIRLFGRERGSGESIWDIKAHIGYMSPELHRYMVRDVTVLNLVAGGLSDALGRFRSYSEEEWALCRRWLQIFGAGHLAERNFKSLSIGEQRLVLLVRTFVKDPSLLILDEPLHGLDSYRRHLVTDIIQCWCGRPGKTLIMVTHYPEELPPVIDRHLHLERKKR